MSSSSHPLSIFREYILQLKSFPDIINSNTKEFDFILGFASETKGNGQFVPNWNVVDLSPQRVMELKAKHSNVRVVISIGGVDSEFSPIDEPKEKWITTAVSSIKAIIKQYKIDGIDGIDGIDIHYDVIKSSEAADFASYIGEVIQQLKDDRELSIKVVSIAPTEKVQLPYRTLYSENRNNIDWVDYRFYDQKFNSGSELIEYYTRVVNDYDPGKVLAGISIPPDPIIFDGIKDLICNYSMPGAFVWNADKSAGAPVPFFVEKELQNL